MSKPLHAIVLHVDSTEEPVDIDRGAELETLQGIVGGYIEAVAGNPDYTLTFWINEEGKLLGLPPNRRATLLWWRAFPQMIGRDILCGPAVLTGGPDGRGETKSLPTCFRPLEPDNITHAAIFDRFFS